MGEEEGCGNRKFDVASLGRKPKFHLLVYIIDLMVCLYVSDTLD
jgi:hypothetical protein